MSATYPTEENSVTRSREKGVFYSAALHILFFLLAFFGLPSFLNNEPPPEPAAITVEILPITGITNVKPSEEMPTPEEKKVDKSAEQAKPSPPVKTAEATPPPPPKEDAVTKPEKKEEKKVEKPEDKKDDKKKTKDDNLDAILKAVKDTAQKEKKDKSKETESSKSKSFSTKFDPSMQLSMSEKDAIMSQIAKCWSVPAGAKDAQNLVVVVMAEFNADGSYIKVELADESKSRYSRDSFFRAAADSAIRAVKQCSPLKGLPPERYHGWSQLELHFDPKYMLN